MAYNHKEWSVYVWDEALTSEQNIQRARNTDSLIRAEDLQKYEDTLRSHDERITELENLIEGLTEPSVPAE